MTNEELKTLIDKIIIALDNLLLPVSTRFEYEHQLDKLLAEFIKRSK